MSEEKKILKIINDKYLNDLKSMVIKSGINPETVDWVSLDWSLTYEELKNIVYSTYCKNIDDYKMIDEAEMQSEYEYGKMLPRSELLKANTIAIFGEIGTAKTSLAYKILENLQDRPIYIVKHPHIPTIQALGYKNLESLEDLENMQDCIVFWDEPQLSTGIYSNKTNDIIAKVCSLSRQRNILLIISSSDSRCFTKHNESYFDTWLIKNIEYSMVKNGSKIKEIIRKNTKIDPAGFRLKIDEFVCDSRRMNDLDGRPNMNGKHTFKLPNNWSEALSKPYRLH